MRYGMAALDFAAKAKFCTAEAQTMGRWCKLVRQDLPRLQAFIAMGGSGIQQCRLLYRASCCAPKMTKTRHRKNIIFQLCATIFVVRHNRQKKKKSEIDQLLAHHILRLSGRWSLGLKLKGRTRKVIRFPIIVNICMSLNKRKCGAHFFWVFG